MNFKKKIAGALITGTLLAGALLPGAAFADQTCTISDNGAFSHNRCRIKVVKKQTVIQSNVAVVTNGVIIVASTGGNSASFNTGGTTSITSGSSTVTVTITNTLNSNTAVVNTPVTP
ncbi:MAG: hypothetical protein AAB521_03405 [Patescibacteria group bacterium]